MYIKDKIKKLKKEQKMLEKIYLKYPQTQELDSFSEGNVKYYFGINLEKSKFNPSKHKYFFNDSLETNYPSPIIIRNNSYEVHINNEEKLIFITNTTRLAFNLNAMDILTINIENFNLNSKLIDRKSVV